MTPAEFATIAVMVLGTAAVGVLGIVTWSWYPLIVGYPMTAVATIALARIAVRRPNSDRTDPQ